jgi:LemA protein
MKSTFIVVALIVLIALWVITSYNRLVRLNISADEAFSQIEVQLKRRADLIPELSRDR